MSEESSIGRWSDACVGFVAAGISCSLDLAAGCRGAEASLAGWMGRVAVVLLAAWLVRWDEFSLLLARLLEPEVLSDWRLLVAASLWACSRCLANWKTVRDLDDSTIDAFYSGNTRKSQR